MGFDQALSGLMAASQNLDTIGNNIANASTVGYKEVRAEFADVYAASLWGSSALQIGIGTDVAAIKSEFTQGTITTTNNPLDIAINGNGFFRETSNGVVSYSRNGEFSLNADGYIVNSAGAELTGYPADANGNITSAPPGPLSLSQAPVPPAATSQASLSLNLNASATVPTATPFSTSNSASYNSSTSMTVYDAQGTSHTLTLYFAKTATNNWNVYATSDGTLLNGTTAAPVAAGTLAFGSSGTLNPANTVTMNLSIPATGSATAPLNFPLTFPAVSTTQFGTTGFSVSANTQNGYAPGQLAGFSISATGVISGNYTNGQTRAQGQICLANFANPQGLIPEGGNRFAQSAASGQPVVGAPGAGSLGSLQAGALESSTVDLTTELVNMITAQRVYQANSETVKTEDQVQQTLMNLR